MYDEKKVKELKLRCDSGNTKSCYEKIGLNSCGNICCIDCSQLYSEKHFKVIQEEQKFGCTNCAVIRKKLKMPDYVVECYECETYIEKYITADFKDIFNSIGDKNV